MSDHLDTGTGWPEGARSPGPADDPATPALADGAMPSDVPVADASVPPDEWNVDAAGVDPDGVEAAGAAPEPAPASPARARRVRVSGAGAVIAVLLVLFGFALVVQLRSNSSDEQLSTARPEDLVRILSDLDARKDRLSQEISQLQTTQQQLAAGTQGRAAALAAAAKRATDLGILAGTIPAQGPGLVIQFVAGAKGIQGSAAVILDAVQELRDAGAEAMEIDGGNGSAVRIVASSWFVDAPEDSLLVDDTTLLASYRLTVIGDPQTMRTALTIPGGVVERVHNAGGNVIVSQPGTVRVTTLHQPAAPRYARPAS